jgi:hypothetical protein
MSGYVRISQNISGYVRLCQGKSDYVRIHQVCKVMSGYFRLDDVRKCKVWLGRVNPG